jgi:hypothetical protein
MDPAAASFGIWDVRRQVPGTRGEYVPYNFIVVSLLLLLLQRVAP